MGFDCIIPYHCLYNFLISDFSYFFRDLSISCDDSLMGLETFTWINCFESLQKQRASIGASQTSLSPSKKSISDISKAVLQLWFFNV